MSSASDLPHPDDPPAWPTLATGAVIGLLTFALGLLAAVIARGGLAGPGDLVALHREQPLLLLAWSAPPLLVWCSWLVHRASLAEAHLEAHLDQLGPFSDGAVARQLLDGVLLVDASGTIVAANRAAEVLLDYRGALDGLPLPRVLPDFDRTEPGRSVERRTPAQRVLGTEWSMTARTSGEATFPVQVTCAPATERRVLYVLRPAGSDRSAETGPPVTVETLRAQRDDEREKSRVKSAFLASMSHELRTPLNAIIGYAELVVEELDDHHIDLSAELGGIRTAASHLLRLLDDILDLSKIEAGRMSVVLEPLPVHPLVDAAMATVAPLIEQGGSTLKLQLDPSVRTVRGDEMRLKQVLVNLLGNAAKFTEAGTVTLDVRAESGAHGRDEVVFEVHDTGIGISEDQVRRLFRDYAQADASIRRRFGGTGLGLALSRRFVELMEGTIDVRSELGVGSTFTVRLPTSTHRATLIPDFSDDPTIPPGSDEPIVFVDEATPALRELVRRQLDEHEIPVLFASPTVRPSELIDLEPRAIVVDLDLPGAADLIADLGASADLARVPILGLTFEDETVDPPSGARELLAKPLDVRALLPAVRRTRQRCAGALVLAPADAALADEVVQILARTGWRVALASTPEEAASEAEHHLPALLLVVPGSAGPALAAGVDATPGLGGLPALWVGSEAPDPDRYVVAPAPGPDDPDALSDAIVLALMHHEMATS